MYRPFPPPPSPKKITSLPGMTYRTWPLSVAKSWWITWLLPTSANVPRRLAACVTVAVAVARWKATWRPAQGKQVTWTSRTNLVMSLNRYGVGWRSVLNKILFWCEHFWKGTFMSEKRKMETVGGAKMIQNVELCPNGHPIYSLSPFEIKIHLNLNASNSKKKNPHIRISAIQSMNPSTIVIVKD